MATESTNNICPYCKEDIKPDAIKCKHCGSQLAQPKPSHKGICPYCKEDIHLEAVKCKHCQSNLTLKEQMDCGCGKKSENSQAAGQIQPFITTTDFSRFPSVYEFDVDEEINSPVSPSSISMVSPENPGFGGTLSAWGCWTSTCCRQTGLCRDRGGRYYRCCTKREKCTRCLWPY